MSKMTIERGGRPTSPVHLHVDEATPVHVHVKKQPHSGNKPISDLKTRSSVLHGASNLRRSTATAHSRSKSPNTAGVWVPPPGKSTKGGGKLSWQGPSHRLELNTGTESNVKIHDLSTDDEERVHHHMRHYENKIDSLMSEVGTLKSEVELQRTLRDMEKKDELLLSTRKKAEEKEAQLQDYQRELQATEMENRILRQNLDSSLHSRYDGEAREELMKKLVEVELDGQAAAKQVSALHDSMRRLKEDRKLSATDLTMLNKQRVLLLERLSDFESTNRTLRNMLRDQHEQQANEVRLYEQRDVLLSKLTHTEDIVQKLNVELREKERQIQNLSLKIDTQQEENVAISGLQVSLENTRGHLQKQLRQKDADCNRMAVQIRTIESQLAQEKIEVDHLQELLGAAKSKADKDKEALKKATRFQKQRASRSEDAVEHLNAQLLERDTHIVDLNTQISDLQSHYDKLAKEKAQVTAESNAIKTRVGELEKIMHTSEESCKAEVEDTMVKLQKKTAEASALSIENDRMKMSLVTIEEKLVQSEKETTHLRSNIRQYETLVEEYKSQMNKSRRETDETMVELEEQKRELSRLQTDSDLEIDKVKLKLEKRLCDLESLPEMLRLTELKLDESQERIRIYERKNVENAKLIAELSTKVEYQASDLDRMREKVHFTGDEHRSASSKLDVMERKLNEVQEQNKDLLMAIAKKEEAMHQCTIRLEEKTKENSTLSRQVENALLENRKQLEHARDKASNKERGTQSRLLELESQLAYSKAEAARLKREKDECERRFNSRLYDLKDRLEQSQSTNRSMQNYVSFLKTSYSNVFGDAPNISHPRTTFN